MFYHHAGPAWLIIVKDCILMSEMVAGLKPLILGQQGKCVTTRLPHLAYVCKTFELSRVSDGGWKQTFDLRLMRQRLYHHAAPSWLIIIKNCVRVSEAVNGLKPLILG
jgi:hypothetical protein